MGRVVLVTGVSMDLVRKLARQLTLLPEVDRVIGVDVLPPRGDLGRVHFVRADIRNPVIAKVIAREHVDTVVHMSVIASPGLAGGRTSMKELNVIGTMQLLGACQGSASVKHLVVKSSTSFYGASSKDPAMFTEEMGPKQHPRSGFGKDVYEVESYVRGFARRRSDVPVPVLRAANVIGPHVQTPMASYFRLPVIPTVLGFDARLQFLHEQDLLAALQLATLSDRAGVFNVAGDGILMMSQAIRRLGKAALPVPSFAVSGLGSTMKRARVADFSGDQVAFLTYGRAVDTTKMRDLLGFEPTFSTAAAFADFAASVTPGAFAAERLEAVEKSVTSMIGGARG